MAGQELESELSTLARALVGSDASLEVMRAASDVGDGAAILRIQDHSFRCVLQISPPAYPEAVRQAGDRARAFAAAVGLSLASAMLLPIAEGYQHGRSFAILPYRGSFSRNKAIWWLQRAHLAPKVLDWLARVAGRADVRNDDAADTDEYRRRLSALIGQEGLDPIARRGAEDVLNRLERGEFEPRLCPMHGDLWLGNVLPAPATPSTFSIIDWGGAEVRGFPIFDLVRLSLSYRVSPRRLNRELLRHAEILGCSTTDTHGHLLAALGHYAIHRGEMPLSNFLAMASRCDAAYRQAMTF